MSRLGKYLLVLVLFGVQSASGTDLEWPLKGKISISSLFCDYRPFHYHSGIDLRTNGKEGLRVYAPADGYLHRTYTSFWGYGKGLYMRLEDGRILVFGHLSRFNAQIEQKVLKEQVQNRSYRTNTYYEPGEILIKRGELLGYTGQSGSGGPHLHFEMRDENENPINPLKHGFRIEDLLSPRFLNLAIRDLSIAALSRDTGSYKIIPAYYERNKGCYELIETPAVSGRFGVEVNVIDRIYRERDSYGVYALEFFLDNDLLFSARFDTISFEITREQELLKDFGLRRQLAGSEDDFDYHTYYNLYDLIHEPTRGVLDTEAGKNLLPGKHEALVRAYDCNDNVSELHFELLVDHPPEIAAFDLSFKGESRFSVRAYVNAGDYAIWVVQFEIQRSEDWEYLGSLPGKGESAVYRIDWVEDFADTFQIRVSALDIWETRSPYLVLGVAGDTLFARSRDASAFESIMTMPDNPGRQEPPSLGPGGGVYRSADGIASVEFERGALYFEIEPDCKIITVEASPFGGSASAAYQFFPQTVPFMKKARFSFDLSSYRGECPRLGIYEQQEDTTFKFRGNEFDDQFKAISAKIDYFATFVLLEDSIPPLISRLYPSSGSTLTNRTPRIFAQLKDDLSGIVKEENIEVTIDGAWVPAEYDYETEQLFYRVRQPLKYGKHILAISATDACGNKTVRSSVFTIAASE